MHAQPAPPCGARHAGTPLGGRLETLANWIAIFFVIHFCWSYYWNCYRKGYAMDIWHFSLFNTLVLIHIMLPFSRSDLNVYAIGAAVRGMQAHVTQAYLISALGYAGILVGGSMWRLQLGLGLRSSFARVVETPRRLALVLLDSRPLLIAHGVVAISLLGAVLSYYFATSGFGLNLRGALLHNPALRAVSNFASFYSLLIGSYCLARAYARRERALLWIVGLIALMQIFSGTRFNIVALFPLTVSIIIMRRGRRFNPLWLIGGLPALIILGSLLDALRQPGLSFQQSFAQLGLSTFYGNSYSDLRDFALILSYWNGKFFYGLTYLAGLIAFVPRFISGFRDSWALGVVTATMAGFSPREHPGLRVGMFGEAFLNFGLVGVILLSLLTGSVTRLIDLRTKQAIHTLPRTSMVAFSYALIGSFLGVLQNSTGASAVYTVLLIVFVSIVALAAARWLKIKIIPDET